MDITKWEYADTDTAGHSGMTTRDTLKKLGKEGWEAFGISSGGTIHLKRPCGRLQIREVEKPKNENGFER